jgi:UDP-2,4-diacetamido-2,4,6-trideoxy-beta-L-altropyranose hydrolase
VRALFAPAAGPEIGGGHLMRDLALAEALGARGVECVFAVPPWGERLIERFGGVGPPVVYPVERSGDPRSIVVVLDALRPDLLVLDDYGLDAEATADLARPGLTVLVVDDLADRTYACDLLVDPGFGREAADYAGRTPPGCQRLIGPPYALLRSAFAQTDAQRDSERPVRRVFLSFGLSDVGAIAARAVERLRPLAADARFDVALASDASSLPRLEALAARDPGVRLHPDALDVAGLMRAADVAVGAGGASTWERCALGLPTLAVVVADNQRAMIERLAAAGVVLAVDAARPGFEAALADRFDALQSPGRRRRLALASRELCDGRGAARVAEAAIARVRARLSGAGTPGS